MCIIVLYPIIMICLLVEVLKKTKVLFAMNYMDEQGMKLNSYAKLWRCFVED